MRQTAPSWCSHKRYPLGALCLAVAVSAGMARPAEADVTVGGTNANNTFPFGTSLYTGESQEVYASSAFPGTVTVTSVQFETMPDFGNPTGSPVTLNFSLGLSNTTASPTSMSTNYAANKRGYFTTVFSGPFTYTPHSNGTFDFVVPITAFTYNPNNGNLLLDVVIDTPSSVMATAPRLALPASDVGPDVGQVHPLL